MSTLRATNIKHESSATNQIVLGADGSIGGTLGDTLAAKVTGSAAGTAPTSPGLGQVWVNTSTNAIKVWDGAAWADPSNAGGYLSAADVSGTTGSPTTGTYTDSEGDWQYYQWTGNGSITLSKAGLARVMVVGGGMNAQTGYSWPDARAGGAAGKVVHGVAYLASGSLTVTIGATANRPSTPGSSSVGSVTAYGGSGSNTGAGSGQYGIASSITGSSLEYGYISGASDPAVTDSGYGAGSNLNNTTGATAGVVIVAVKQ